MRQQTQESAQPNEELRSLANTTRFLKSQNIKKVHKLENHVNKITLNFKDIDMEGEWRLKEMSEKKTTMFLGVCFCLLQDVVWTMILQDTSLNGKIIRLTLDFIQYVAHYQMHYSKKAQDQKYVAQILQNEVNRISKWEVIQHKINQQKESQRQFYWYQILWMCYSFHQLSNDFEYAYVDPNLPDYEIRRLHQDYINYFFVGADLLALCVAIVLLDIHWVIMGFQLTLYCTIQVAHVYFVYNPIFIDYLVLVIFVQPIIFISLYKRIQTSKASFIQDKKIKQLLEEQLKIFQSLPDGAIIHRSSLKNTFSSDEQMLDHKVKAQDQIEVNIRYLNQTFREMFTAYRERLSMAKKLRRKQTQKNKNESKNKLGYSTQTSKEITRSNSPSGNSVNNTQLQLPDDSKAKILNNLGSMADIAPAIEQPNMENQPPDSPEKFVPEDDSENESEPENHFLHSVYLQKSPYIIKGTFVEQIEDQQFQPIQFVDAIKEFDNGQVYSVLTKDEEGNYSTLSKKNDFSFAERVTNEIKSKENKDEKSGYLIYIVTQEVIFDDEISTITYFKDITFGVLYEQIKVQTQLQSLMVNTLQSKMGTPLGTVIQNIESIESSPILSQIETTQSDTPQSKMFRSQLKATKIQATLLIFKIKDMQDWDAIKQGKLRPVSQKFNLQEALEEVYDMMLVKAQIRNIFFKFDQDYFGVRSVNLLPKNVLGDKSRFQQVAINLISNAISNTFKGGVTIYLFYDKKKQKIHMDVQDTGTGIREENQNDLFKMFKSAQMEPRFNDLTQAVGMGLFISKMIVTKFDGTLTFQSVFQKGSVFSYTFSLEEFDTDLVPQFANDSDPQIDSSTFPNPKPGPREITTMPHIATTFSFIDGGGNSGKMGSSNLENEDTIVEENQFYLNADGQEKTGDQIIIQIHDTDLDTVREDQEYQESKFEINNSLSQSEQLISSNRY